jgi:2,4-dienoyl-CoA reductase-like NADH-dependent reductase (Old Yellow Enzyme family)
MTQATLFSPIRIGALDLANRIVMAPLTRNRARHEDDAPQALHVEYYAQRASAGLIITEASQISPEGKGYAWTPGIHSPAQIEGWRAVTDAVHAKGGKIVIQLWHVGRVSHTSLQPNGQPPMATPADIPAKPTPAPGVPATPPAQDTGDTGDTGPVQPVRKLLSPDQISGRASFSMRDSTSASVRRGPGPL